MSTKIPFSDIPGFKPYMMINGPALKKLLIKSGTLENCSKCGITEWLGVPAPLQVDHVNGVREDNTRANLRLLCPNCHALTDTYTGRNVRNRNMSRITEMSVREAYYAVETVKGRPPMLVEVVRALERRICTPYMNKTKEICTDIGLDLVAKGDVIYRDGIPSSDLWPEDSVLAEMIADLTLKGAANKLRVPSNLLYSRSIRREIPRPSRALNSKIDGTGISREKIEWPSDEELADLLRNLPRTEVARRLGVSDNAVKKRCRLRGIEEPDTRRMMPTPPDTVAKREARVTEERLKRLTYLHGTLRGYRLECALGIPTCTDCRSAASENQSAKRERKRRASGTP